MLTNFSLVKFLFGLIKRILKINIIMMTEHFCIVKAQYHVTGLGKIFVERKCWLYIRYFKKWNTDTLLNNKASSILTRAFLTYIQQTCILNNTYQAAV